METFKEFIIFKNTKGSENPKAPTHRIMARIDDTLTEVGAGWQKEKNGNKYLSCKLRDNYKDHTDESKSRKGFHLGIDGLKKPSVEPEIDQYDEF